MFQQRLRGVGIAAAIAVLAALVQGVRLPAVLDGPHLNVALGAAADPHLLSGWLSSALLRHCALGATCVERGNLLAFAVVVFLAGALCGGRPLALVATAIGAVSPLAAALVSDPLGLGSSVGLLLVAAAAVEVAGFADYRVVGRCVLAAALALQDPSLIPIALVYGAFGGAAPLACALVIGGARFFLERPAVNPIAGPATLVAFGACLFVGGPILMLLARYRAFSRLPDEGRALLRAAALAIAALVGGLFSGSGDTAPYWLCGEAALLVGLVASVRTVTTGKTFERAGLLFAVLAVVQFGLFLQHHRDVTTAAIAYRGDDLRGMLAATPERACVASDALAKRYVLAGGAFLKMYPPRIAPKQVTNVADCLDMPQSATIVTMIGLAVNNWGRAVPLMQAYRDASDPNGVLQIEGGAVSPATHVGTPTGRGAFGNQLDTPLGSVGDFTVLSGFAYTPQCLPVGVGKHLAFSAASIPGTPSLQITVRAKSSGKSQEILSQVFPAADANEPYAWHRYVVPVAPSDCTALTFAVGTPGSAAGPWLTFAGASIR